VQLLNRFYDPS